MKFSQFVGQDNAKLGVILNALEPRCGGLLLVGAKGSGKSTLIRLARGIFPVITPFVEIPLNITEDSLLGGIDIEQSMREGRRIFLQGLIPRAAGGILFVDDINLLPQELLAPLMAFNGGGDELQTCPGSVQQLPRDCCVMGTMNPEEGDIQPHYLDRFGLCAVMDELPDCEKRLDVLRIFREMPNFQVESDPSLMAMVATAKKHLPEVKVGTAELENISAVAVRNPSHGHRGELFLFYAARAYAALQGHDRIAQSDIERVSELVFVHRRLHTSEEHSDLPQDEKHRESATDQMSPPEPEKKAQSMDADFSLKPRGSAVTASGAEETMSIGNPFQVRRLSFKKDRLKRHAAGKRSKTHSLGKGGRHVRSTMNSAEQDIAIDATLRACAPYQKSRGREVKLIIERDDWRFRQRERKTGHLVIFAVDGSGSMGARRRMVAAKGAIQSLLTDCYQKRDKVAMIVFRQDCAELVLPPTSSVELASKRLSTLPVGGKTPLAAGLLETFRLIKRFGVRHPETRFLTVLITDGKGNQSITVDSDHREEEQELCKLLSAEPKCDFVVVDTESKDNFIKTDMAVRLAENLGAEYYTVEALRAELLSELIQSKNRD
ncbi:MAG: VWA domain-containing protein [Victivallaceae bacterium]|nr:VWA domain-containing protein [Victivallaceae bacterium]MDD3703053.1 VWA domain-containing protein [Victivallaceae bacterium]MDD4317967.1 VWA domain-containing protein [Victivallaceae bacterium]MDD5663869.1 VWA domain-containing protein [Victivallaceae bacterium]NLK83181.1 VWA domain-containing protein [Lentisphaerota bacterium]